jgi:Domain of unknown function (DUF4062)
MSKLGPSVVERLRVFVASPGDVERERDHTSAVADELNRGVAADAGFVLEVVRWETHARPDMGRPQQLILDQIGSVDIFIGIMWHRFGTPTGVAGSGTEEEFDRALESWQRTGRPRMLCYFGRAPIDPPSSVEEASQLLKVAQFRKRVEAVGLAWTYSSDTEFKDSLREHLQQVLLNEFAGRRPPLDRNLAALLDIEKERCRERNVMFLTPNLLLSLLAVRTSPARRIFDQACPEMAEEIVDGLRRYEPGSSASHSTSFSEFDWYDRDDVQAARHLARQECKAAIDARHLLLGFLDTESETRTELRRALGDEGFHHLRRLAETAEQIGGTPGVGGLFKRPVIRPEGG